jgi:hypothetical protein
MAFPTSHDQYMLELINRDRLNPQGAADLYLSGDLNEGLTVGTISTDTKQPLAFNLNLNLAAQGHSQWMLDNDTFSHTGEGSTTSRQRMENAGYTFTSPSGSAENIAWIGTTGTPNFTNFVRTNYENLFIDEDYPGRGHRVTLMNGDLQEIGISSLQGSFLGYNAVMTTQDFAYSATSGPFITGVAYTDAIANDNFYTVGEGIGGVTVTAVDITNNANTFTTTTWNTGGYSLAVNPNATYDVTFSGDLDQDGQADDTATYRVSIGADNLKQDVVSDSLPGSNVNTAPTFIFWRNSSSGLNFVWYLSNTVDNTVTPTGDTQLPTVVGDNYILVGTGDLDSNGKEDDLVWREKNADQTFFWYGEYNGQSSELQLTGEGGEVNLKPGSNWDIKGIGDFDGDGYQDDLLWFDESSRLTSIWYINNEQVVGGGLVAGTTALEAGWTLATVGNFDNDGLTDDLVWRNTNTGDNYIWLMNGTTPEDGDPLWNVPTNWQLVGASDYDGDSIDNELVWHDPGSGAVVTWSLDGTTPANLKNGVTAPAGFTPVV